MRMNEFYSTTLKRKRVIVDQERKCYLNISVFHAEDIDCVTRHPNGEKRIYKVIGWVNPGEEFSTQAAEGLPNPQWKIKFHIPLGMYDPYKQLNVEVVRVDSTSDPGTSNGCILVGRAQIPLPKLDQKTQGRFGLVAPPSIGSSVVAEGHIILSMELKSQPSCVYIMCPICKTEILSLACWPNFTHAVTRCNEHQSVYYLLMTFLSSHIPSFAT